MQKQDLQDVSMQDPPLHSPRSNVHSNIFNHRHHHSAAPSLQSFETPFINSENSSSSNVNEQKNDNKNTDKNKSVKRTREESNIEDHKNNCCCDSCEEKPPQKKYKKINISKWYNRICDSINPLSLKDFIVNDRVFYFVNNYQSYSFQLNPAGKNGTKPTKKFFCMSCGIEHNVSDTDYIDFLPLVEDLEGINSMNIHPGVMSKLLSNKRGYNRVYKTRCCLKGVESHNMSVLNCLKEPVNEMFKAQLDIYCKKIKQLENDLNKATSEKKTVKAKDIDFTDESIIDKIAEVIRGECKSYIKYFGKTKGGKSKSSMKNLMKYDLEDERNEKCDMLLSKILDRLCKTHRREIDEITENTIQKLKLTSEGIMSMVFKIVDLGYNSKFNHLLTLMIHQLTHSDLVKNILNHMGLSLSSTQTKKFLLNESLKTSMRTKIPVTDYVVSFVLDNVQKLQSNSRSTRDKKTGIHIFTNIGYYEINILLKNLNFVKRSEYMNIETLKKLDFEEVFEKEKDRELHDEYQKMIFLRIRSNLVNERKQHKNDLVEKFGKTIQTFKKKWCEQCDKYLGSYEKFCDVCGTELELISVKKNRVDFYEKDIADSNRDLLRTEIFKNDDTIAKSIKETFDYNESPGIKDVTDACEDAAAATVANNNDNKLNNSDDGDDDFAANSDDYEDTGIHIFRGYNKNPGKLSSLRHIKVDLKKKIEKTKQEFTCIINDGSPQVLYVNDIIENPEEYEDFLSFNGLFHLKQEFTRLILGTVKESCPELISNCGWSSPKQLNYIAKCKDFHKSWDVVKVIYRSLFKELCLIVENKSTLSMENITYLCFKRYLNELEEENTHISFSIFLFESINALMMLHYGIRNKVLGGYKFVDAATRILTPLVFLGEYNIYQKIIMFEQIQRFLMPERIKKLMAEVSLMMCKDGIKSEAVDAKLEELNRWLKSVLCGDAQTGQSWTISSSLFNCLMPIRDLSLKLYVCKDRVRVSKEVSQVINELYVRLYLRKSNFFDKVFTYLSLKYCNDDNTSSAITGNDYRELKEELNDRTRNFFYKTRKCIAIKKKLSCRRVENFPVTIRSTNEVMDEAEFVNDNEEEDLMKDENEDEEETEGEDISEDEVISDKKDDDLPAHDYSNIPPERNDVICNERTYRHLEENKKNGKGLLCACEKFKIFDTKNTGRCDVQINLNRQCKKYFKDQECGNVINVYNGKKFIFRRSICCCCEIIQLCCGCCELFTNRDDFDVCVCCRNFFHTTCLKNNLLCVSCFEEDNRKKGKKEKKKVKKKITVQEEMEVD